MRVPEDSELVNDRYDIEDDKVIRQATRTMVKSWVLDN
jgi:hypothetical protein